MSLDKSYKYKLFLKREIDGAASHKKFQTLLLLTHRNLQRAELILVGLAIFKREFRVTVEDN